MDRKLSNVVTDVEEAVSGDAYPHGVKALAPRGGAREVGPEVVACAKPRAAQMILGPNQESRGTRSARGSRRGKRLTLPSPALQLLYSRAKRELACGAHRAALSPLCQLLLALPCDHPAEATLRLTLAEIYLELGRYEQALAQARTVQGQNPGSRLPGLVAERAFFGKQQRG